MFEHLLHIRFRRGKRESFKVYAITTTFRLERAMTEWFLEVLFPKTVESFYRVKDPKIDVTFYGVHNSATDAFIALLENDGFFDMYFFLGSSHNSDSLVECTLDIRNNGSPGGLPPVLSVDDLLGEFVYTVTEPIRFIEARI